MLVAAFVSCGLDGKVKKINKAAMKGNPKKVVKLCEKLDKYDEEDWTPEQIEILANSLDSLKKYSTIADYEEYEKELIEFEVAADALKAIYCNY